MSQTKLTNHDNNEYPELTDEGYIRLDESETAVIIEHHTVVDENDEAVLLYDEKEDQSGKKLLEFSRDMDMSYVELRDKMFYDTADKFDDNGSGDCWLIAVEKHES